MTSSDADVLLSEQLTPDDIDASRSAKEAILAVTIDIISSSGEAGVRLATVAERAGVAIGLISYHFGDRDGLVQAAQLVRYRRRPQLDVDGVEAIVARATTRDELIGLLRALTTQSLSAVLSEGSRLQRASILGSSLGRPDLYAALGNLQAELTDQYEAMIRMLIERGVVRADLDARAVAVFVQAYAFGFVLGEIDPRCPDVEALADVVTASLEGIIVGPVSRS